MPAGWGPKKIESAMVQAASLAWPHHARRPCRAQHAHNAPGRSKLAQVPAASVLLHVPHWGIAQTAACGLHDASAGGLAASPDAFFSTRQMPSQHVQAAGRPPVACCTIRALRWAPVSRL